MSVEKYFKLKTIFLILVFIGFAGNCNINGLFDQNKGPGMVTHSCEGSISSPNSIGSGGADIVHNGIVASGCESYYVVTNVPAGSGFTVTTSNVTTGSVGVSIHSASTFDLTSQIGSIGWSSGGSYTGVNNSSSTLYLKVSIGNAGPDGFISYTLSITFNAGSICGNSIIEAGEQCDDEHIINGDGCSSSCQLEAVAICGNNIIEPPSEQCDDGNTVSGDGCSSTCQTEVITGSPDLQLTFISVTNTTAFNAQITVTVTNAGTASAPGPFNIMGWGNSFVVPTYQSAQSGCFVSESTGIAAGATVNYLLNCGGTFMPGTAYTSYVIVDFGQVVTEIDETNNTISQLWSAL